LYRQARRNSLIWQGVFARPNEASAGRELATRLL
jgi:hypothetical protein